MGGGRAPGMGRGGHSPYLGKTGCPRSGWLPGPAVQTHSGRSRHGQRADCVRDTRAPGHPGGGACRGALGLHPPQLHCPRPRFWPHIWAGGQGAGRREEGHQPTQQPTPTALRAGRSRPRDVPYSFTGQLPRPLQVQDGEAAVRVPGMTRPRAAGAWGCGEPGGSAPRQRCACLCSHRLTLEQELPWASWAFTAAALPTDSIPGGRVSLGGCPACCGHPDPGEAAAGGGAQGPPGTHSWKVLGRVMAEP